MRAARRVFSTRLRGEQAYPLGYADVSSISNGRDAF